ncbi:MAG: hypothetical protein V3S31_05940 [Dehalococcoidia bacterium]
MRHGRAALALAMVAMVVAACTGDDAPRIEKPTPVPTAERLRAADVPPHEGSTRALTGLFTAPRETQADVTRSIGPIPPSRFSQWDGDSVVLYEIATGAETDLGEGSIALSPFSPDGRKFAWVSGPLTFSPSALDSGANEVWVIDLETLERRSYGKGWQVEFEDDNTLRVTERLGGREYRLIDLDIGELFAVRDDASEDADTLRIVQYPFGYRLERTVEGMGVATNSQNLLVPDDGSPALEFTSWLAIPLNADELLVGVAAGGSGINLFLVDIAAGEATFIATARGIQSVPARFSFVREAPAAPPTHVVWSEYGCDPERGRTRIYDLRSRTLTEIDRALPLAGGTGGRLALGFLNFRRAVLDLETLEYSDVMPGGFGPLWSGDERWAANGPSIFSLVGTSPCEQGDQQ